MKSHSTNFKLTSYQQKHWSEGELKPQDTCRQPPKNQLAYTQNYNRISPQSGFTSKNQKGGEKTRKTTITLIAALSALTLFFIAPACLAKPTQVSGTWRATSGPTLIGPEHTAGGNHFDAFTNTGEYLTGPITGTFEQTITVTFHTGEPTFVEAPPLTFFWRIDRTIDATINSKSGTIIMRLLTKGTTTSTGTTLEGTWVIISATDELHGLHGQGTWWNIPPGRLGYEGQLNFAPQK